MTPTAEVIAASEGLTGVRLCTIKATMPRYILAELNTHRMFSRNSASSRAIPFKKMVAMVMSEPFIPMAFQKDHKGMQGTDYITDRTSIQRRTDQWMYARDLAVLSATKLYEPLTEYEKAENNKAFWEDEESVTKQLCNRILEPYMWHTVLISATHYENFFAMRCPQYTLPTDTVYRSKKDVYKDYPLNGESGILRPNDSNWLILNKGQADIHMMSTAEVIWDAYNSAKFQKLENDEWHLPFGDMISESLLTRAMLERSNPLNVPVTENTTLDHRTLLAAKIQVCTARCARISYQTLGDNPSIDYSADLKLFEQLSKNGHLSPFEHVAKKMTNPEWHDCRKAIMKDGDIGTEYGWMYNFRGFIQMRAYLS